MELNFIDIAYTRSGPAMAFWSPRGINWRYIDFLESDEDGVQSIYPESHHILVF